MVVRSFSEWLFNVLVWGAVVSLLVLCYDAFASPGFLAAAANPIGALIGAGVVVVLAVLWPRY
jgi:hypothetical protein